MQATVLHHTAVTVLGPLRLHPSLQRTQATPIQPTLGLASLAPRPRPLFAPRFPIPAGAGRRDHLHRQLEGLRLVDAATSVVFVSKCGMVGGREEMEDPPRRRIGGVSQSTYYMMFVINFKSPSDDPLGRLVHH